MNKGKSWTAKNPAHSDELWALAERMNGERPGLGTWVPKQAVAVPDWQVRTLNDEKVREYADVSEHLPPIRVQRDTYVLIDGRHRLSAEPSDCVRIVEDDVADADLFIEQVKANSAHGLPYTRVERERLIKEIIKRYPGETDTKVAEIAGCERHTVGRFRSQLAPRTPTSPVQNPAAKSQSGSFYHNSGEANNRPSDPAPRVPAKSFDPGPEEPPEREDVDPETGEIVSIGATTLMDPDDWDGAITGGVTGGVVGGETPAADDWERFKKSPQPAAPEGDVVSDRFSFVRDAVHGGAHFGSLIPLEEMGEAMRARFTVLAAEFAEGLRAFADIIDLEYGTGAK